ncbi:unnamed protein product [Caenorhabditis nigoni]
MSRVQLMKMEYRLLATVPDNPRIARVISHFSHENATTLQDVESSHITHPDIEPALLPDMKKETPQKVQKPNALSCQRLSLFPRCLQQQKLVTHLVEVQVTLMMSWKPTCQ